MLLAVEVAETLSKILDLILEHESKEDVDATFALASSRFVILVLRGILISQLSPTTTRRHLTGRLLDIILDVNSNAEANIQRACLFHSLHPLLPLQDAVEDEVFDKNVLPCLDEGVTHCLVNPLAVQKCFYLIGPRLRVACEHLRATPKLSPGQASLEGSFFIILGYNT